MGRGRGEGQATAPRLYPPEDAFQRLPHGEFGKERQELF